MARLKERIGKKVLKNKLKGFERQVRVHNFETAKSAVILFDANDPASFPQIKEFRKFVESKGIQCKSKANYKEHIIINNGFLKIVNKKGRIV